MQSRLLKVRKGVRISLVNTIGEFFVGIVSALLAVNLQQIFILFKEACLKEILFSALKKSASFDDKIKVLRSFSGHNFREMFLKVNELPEAATYFEIYFKTSSGKNLSCGPLFSDDVMILTRGMYFDKFLLAIFRNFSAIFKNKISGCKCAFFVSILAGVHCININPIQDGGKKGPQPVFPL